MKIEYKPMRKRAEFQSNYRKENIKLKREIEGLKEANAQLKRELEKVNNTRTVKIGSSKEIDYGLKLKELEEGDPVPAILAKAYKKKHPELTDKQLYFYAMDQKLNRLFNNTGKDPEQLAEELSIRTGIEIPVEALLNNDNYDNFISLSDDEPDVLSNFHYNGVTVALRWNYEEGMIVSVNGEIYED